MILQAPGSLPLNSAIHGLLWQAWLSCGIHSLTNAPNLTVSYKLVSAKPFKQSSRPRLPILDAAVLRNALWLQHQGPLLKLKASCVLGESLKKDGYEKHLPSNTWGGQIRLEPNSLQFQLHGVESLFLGLRKLKQRQWSRSCGRPSWDLAHASSFIDPARMGRSTSHRRRPAYYQEKTELHDLADESHANGGQEALHSGKMDFKESTLPSANEVDISDEPKKVLAEKHVQLEARLTAFQKAGNLDELTVAELKGIMKLRNQPTKGRKQDLLQQLERMLSEPAGLVDAQEQQLEEPGEMENTKYLTPHISQRKGGMKNVKPSRGIGAAEIVSQGEMAIDQQRHIGNAAVPGVDRKVGSVIKVYRSRRARTQESDTKADVAGESNLPVKRTKIGNSGESIVTVVVPEKIAVKAIWATFNHKRPQPGWYAYDPSTMRPDPLADRSTFHKLVSWNVNGVRALLKGKDAKTHDAAIFKDLAELEDFDILCLQETKLQEKDVNKVKQCLLPEFEGSYWTCSTAKLGYSGTAIISRVKPLSVNYGLGVADHDQEGRLITAEFDTFYLVTSYVPNSGDGLKRLDYRITGWDPALSSHVKELEKKKPVILTGDLNCCHQEMDIADPNANRRSAGFTDEERVSFEESYLKKGFVDTFRRQHPNAVGYTYWGYRTGARARNHGWRLDYFLASESLCDRLHDSYSMPHVHGSDHCPIGLILKA